MLCVQNHHQVENLGLERRVFVALEQIQEVFSRRQIEMEYFGLGENFTLTDSMNVREAPGINYSVRKVSQITANGRENVVDTNPSANAVFKPGTVVTALELKAVHTTTRVDVWLHCPSGWICARMGDEVFVD